MVKLQHAWANIATNQDQEGFDYGVVDPKQFPAWPTSGPGSRESSNPRNQNYEWLNQDSIDSLNHASASYTMASNSARRVEPIRLSVPVSNPPITQRGRCGKLADSQQYTHTGGRDGHGNLLQAKQHLRQAMSVHKVDRTGTVDSRFKDFNPNRTDSFVTNDHFNDERIEGRACI